MKTIIAGSRGFNDYGLLCQICKEELLTEVVSGTARGADQLGERYSDENGIPKKQFPADWDKYGKSAGYKRNTEMAKYADALIAFWDGESRGTKHMIDLAKQHNLKTRVVIFNSPMR